MWSRRRSDVMLIGLCLGRGHFPTKTGAQWQPCRHKGTTRAGVSAAGGKAADLKLEPDMSKIKADIRHRISSLKVSELNSILRSCGLVQGTGKEFKLAALCDFVCRSQELAEKRHRSRCRLSNRSGSEIYESFVPEEVVSIDIGFRNLAFAHMSSSGQVLDWRRVELLKEAAFEPWVLASVVEEFVQSVLPVRPATACTYVIEHQRFRSQGSAAVTNSVMVNNLIEALLYANLRHAGAHVEPINPTLISSHWGFIGSRKRQGLQPCDEENDQEQPKESAKSDAKEQLVETMLAMEAALREQKTVTRAQHALLFRALDLKPSRRATTTRSASLQDTDKDRDRLQTKTKTALSVSRDLKRRLLKKERTIAMVQAWVLASLVATKNDHQASKKASSVKNALHDEIQSCLAQFSGAKHALGSGQPMRFSDAAAEMFCKETKQDDLCDCVVQGVAWYQWQQYIVGVLKRFGSESEPES
ncbi:hypothetical protein H4R99_007474 [Coemansia sp. RSA 1722]|nr:hypothetical protein H4R99_007474 [Coemansia sp. RSA 1722]